jgi:hypothetical protein
VILSIENHCSLQQQARMAQIFQVIIVNNCCKRFSFILLQVASFCLQHGW